MCVYIYIYIYIYIKSKTSQNNIKRIEHSSVRGHFFVINKVDRKRIVNILCLCKHTLLLYFLHFTTIICECCDKK